ncbi:hypothetical protein A2U01_0038242, partial [Trifolium medium]|nr:hypothetical protein [Trifolium medium]
TTAGCDVSMTTRHMPRKESLGSDVAHLEPIVSVYIREEIRVGKPNVVPKVMRELTVSDAMKKILILEATTNTSSGEFHLVMVEQIESGHRVVASQPKEESDLSRKMKLPNPRPRLRGVRGYYWLS